MFDGIFGIALSLWESFVGMLPTININETAIDKLFEILHLIAWFFPIDTVFAILSVFILIQSVRIGISVLTAIWNMIPVL